MRNEPQHIVLRSGDNRWGSCVTQPEAIRLRSLAEEFLRRVDVVPWDRDCAARYDGLRAALGSNGKALAPLDLQIVAQAQAMDAVLASNDKTFAYCEGLNWENWTV